MKNVIKKWFTEQHVLRVRAEQAFEEEKAQAIAVLEQEKSDLEQTLSAYNLHNLNIDYEGIEQLSFDGNIVYVYTKGERYVVRLHQDEDLFAFVKKLGFNNTTNTISGRETWIIKTPLASNAVLPSLDILSFREKEAIITLDLTKIVNVTFIRGLIDAIHGEFSLSINADRVAHTLSQLVRELNAFHTHAYSIQVDATNVRGFTFYAVNNEGNTYDLSHLGLFNVEQLLYDKESFTNKVKELLSDKFSSIHFHFEGEKRKKERVRLMKEARERIDELNLTHLDVMPTISNEEKLLEFTSLNKPIHIHMNAPDNYFSALSVMNKLKEQAENESDDVQWFLKRMTLKQGVDQPFSFEDNYINIFMPENKINFFLQEIKENGFRKMKEVWQHKIQLEEPAIQQVLERLEVEVIPSHPNPLISGKVSCFLEKKKYDGLIENIRTILIRLAQMEYSNEYIDLDETFNYALFGLSIHKEHVDSNKGRLLVLTIEKEKTYKKYFKKGRLLSSDEINTLTL